MTNSGNYEGGSFIVIGGVVFENLVFARSHYEGGFIVDFIVIEGGWFRRAKRAEGNFWAKISFIVGFLLEISQNQLHSKRGVGVAAG